MIDTQATSRRGLTVLELVLALTVTAMVALAVSGMLNVVSTGVGARNDSRTVMVLAGAARQRLGAYVDPSRCVLGHSSNSLVLWFNDARESDTVHATEIRWLDYDSNTGTIDVSYVQFPDNWTKTAKELADQQYPSNADWQTVRATYQAQGHLKSVTIIDGLTSCSISADANTSLDARHLVFKLGIDTQAGSQDIEIPATIRLHQQPSQ